MNTPPAIDPDIAHMELDPSWAIFDESSNRLAAETFFQQIDVGENSTLGTGNLNCMTDNGLGVHVPPDFDNSKSWNGHENLIDTWPSNLLRVFGNSEYQPSNHDTGNFATK